jgi:uncharacterized cupredoxin-like copper-binding protein
MHKPPISGGVSCWNDRVIEVDLNSFIVDADQTTISAGEVTFATTNSDFVVHELLVVPVADLDEELPYDFNTSRAIEDEIEILGVVENLEAGKSEALTLDLPPGTYLLICNLTAHYQAGCVRSLRLLNSNGRTRQAEQHHRSYTGRTLDADRTTLGLHQGVGNRQSQAAAAAAARMLVTIEALEDVRKMVWIDSAARIGDAEINHCRFTGSRAIPSG